MEPSPSTLRVFQAFNSRFTRTEDGVPGPQFHAIAAAIRIASEEIQFFDQLGLTAYGGFAQAQKKLDAIASELEAMSQQLPPFNP